MTKTKVKEELIEQCLGKIRVSVNFMLQHLEECLEVTKKLEQRIKSDIRIIEIQIHDEDTKNDTTGEDL